MRKKQINIVIPLVLQADPKEMTQETKVEADFLIIPKTNSTDPVHKVHLDLEIDKPVETTNIVE